MSHKWMTWTFKITCHYAQRALLRTAMRVYRQLESAPVIFVVLATLLVATLGQLCISQGPRFPKFSLEGKPPRKSLKGSNDLSLCRIYRSRTCCTASQTQQALVTLKKLAVNGEASSECLGLWEVLECAVCDPRVGILPGPPVLCHEFCESVFNACSSAFFSMDQSKQVLLPCGSNDIICAQGKQWTTNSSYFCELTGFRVEDLSSMNLKAEQESTFCFDGKAEVASESKSTPSKRAKSRLTWKKLLRRLRRSVMTENVLWAIGGLVLTAGAALFRQRGIRARQRRMALMKTIYEARTRQQAANNAAVMNKMGRRS